MQSKTIYKTLAVVLLFAAIYYLFFTGPGTEKQSEQQTAEMTEKQTTSDTVETVKPESVTKEEQIPTEQNEVIKRGDVELVEYVVSEGETLGDIAKNLYGDAQMWFKIFAYNESEIDDWNVIRPGQKLLVPRY